MTDRRRRGGFTLLEVILASSISILLLAGLYIALDLQVRLAQASREQVEKVTIVRAIFNRMTVDLAPSLTPLTGIQPGGAGSSSSSSSTGSTSSSSTSSSSTASNTAASSSTATSTSTTAAANSSFAPLTIPLSAGVIGDSQTLNIYITRGLTVKDILDPNVTGSAYNTGNYSSLRDPGTGSDSSSGSSNQSIDQTVQPSDQRRITYWLASTSGSTGLCREEEKWLTSDTLDDSTTPDYQNEPGYVIASEVENLQFEYYDGANWNDTWDGSQAGQDGVTPLGPPVAIRVHLWIRPTKDADAKEYIKVLALVTAANYQGAIAGTTANGTTNSTTGSTSSSTTGSSP